MTFREFLRDRGQEALFDDPSYEAFDGEKMVLDGRYTLEQLRVVVAFMEIQGGTCDMSKRTRGGTREANWRRENHARKESRRLGGGSKV
jgi:hypothetical protein